MKLKLLTAVAALVACSGAQAEYKCNLKQSMGVHTADMRPTGFVVEDEEYRVISYEEMWEKYEAGVFKKDVDQFIEDEVFFGEFGFFNQMFPARVRVKPDSAFYFRSTEVPADWWYGWSLLDVRTWPKAPNGAIAATADDAGNVMAFSPTTGRLVRMPDPVYAWLKHQMGPKANKNSPDIIIKSGVE